MAAHKGGHVFFYISKCDKTKKERSDNSERSVWCGKWDLNPYVEDTRTSNVPVCLFQHCRIY